MQNQSHVSNFWKQKILFCPLDFRMVPPGFRNLREYTVNKYITEKLQKHGIQWFSEFITS